MRNGVFSVNMCFKFKWLINIHYFLINEAVEAVSLVIKQKRNSNYKKLPFFNTASGIFFCRCHNNLKNLEKKLKRKFFLFSGNNFYLFFYTILFVENVILTNNLFFRQIVFFRGLEIGGKIFRKFLLHDAIAKSSY
jgi:hypothetical protein